jgi:hypothetical protein
MLGKCTGTRGDFLRSRVLVRCILILSKISAFDMILYFLSFYEVFFLAKNIEGSTTFSLLDSLSHHFKTIVETTNV